MNAFYFIIFMLSFLNLPNQMPIPGNIFRKTINVPFFGGQTIETEFKQFNNVEIRLSGYVNENGTAKYYLLDDDIEIELSENLNKVLNKYKTNFILNDYDPINEIIEIKIIIRPIFFKTNVELVRIK